MGSEIDYKDFIEKLDARLDLYFKKQAEFVCCKKGCSDCCEKGDYPLSELELKYLMQGFMSLDNETKLAVQQNFLEIKSKRFQILFLLV